MSNIARVIWVWGFPYIHRRARYFESLMRTEDFLHFLGAGHLEPTYMDSGCHA